MDYEIVIPVLISFAISAILGPIVIPFLKRLKVGQTERKELESHLKKNGTPTMGGLMILASIIITSLFYVKDYPRIIPILFMTVGFGVIGFLDDYLKVVLRRSDGLLPWQKMILQFIVTTVFAVYMVRYSGIELTMLIPFSGGKYLNIGWLAIPLLYFAVIGTVNGVNFTDGVDGLVSSVTIMVATFFSVVAIGTNAGIAPITCAVAGALLGFLLFNVYPASVFMGDTGSLALGGFVVATAYMLQMPLYILIVGLIYLAEVISVKSGVAAAELLRKKGITFVLFDGNKDLDVTALIEKNPVFAGAEILLGELAPEDMARIDLVVLSPGVPTDLPMVNELRNRQIPIWGEIELAYHFAKGRIIAITGTNGKTTTTSLVGEIMANYFDDVKVVGNIGIPYTSVAADTTEDTVTVAEISSFQLETTHEFAPEVTAILNITPDHLNRHHTMECYIETKESITKNQTAGDTCVLNYEDEVLRRFGETLQTKVVFFSSKRRLEKGLYLDGEDIFYADGTTDTKVINVNELNILGKHNYENVMAAVGMSVSFGVPMDKIVEVLKRFQAVEHRIEYVTEKRGVKFYNDSKGTNPDAAIQGIRAMNRPTLLIGGGYDKQSEYDEWIESFDGKVKKLVLIGQTKEKIAECAKKHGFEDVILCDTFEEAIDTCYANAVSGDAVLLSPACASWGMFANYEERGRIFKEYVRNLAE